MCLACSSLSLQLATAVLLHSFAFVVQQLAQCVEDVQAEIALRRRACSTSKSLLYSSLPRAREVYRLKLCWAGRQP